MKYSFVIYYNDVSVDDNELIKVQELTQCNRSNKFQKMNSNPFWLNSKGLDVSKTSYVPFMSYV